MNERVVRISDLVLVTDQTPIECLGGPNDGEFLPANENGLRLNGMYVVVNHYDRIHGWRVVAQRYVPS